MKKESSEDIVANINRKSGLLVCLLVTANILLAGLVVYLVCFKGNSNDKAVEDNNKATDVKPDSKVDLPEEKVDEEKLVDFIKDNGLLFLAGETYTNKDIKSSVDSGQMLAFLYSAQDDDKLTKDYTVNYFKRVYGYNLKELPNIVCPVDDYDLYQFNSSKNIYEFNEEHPGHGGFGKSLIDYYVVDSSKDGNIYTIDVIFLYGVGDSGIYVNGEDVTDEMANVYNDDGIWGVSDRHARQYFNEHIDTYKKGKVYRYQFQKTGSDYVVYSIGIAK